MPLLAQNDIGGCVLVGALDEFVQRLDEGPAARSLHYLAGQLHMTGGNAAELQAWVAAVRTRFDSRYAAWFESDIDTAAAASVLCDPAGDAAPLFALDAMRSALADGALGAGVLYSGPARASGASMLGAAVKWAPTRVLGLLLESPRETASDEGALLQSAAALAWHMKCLQETSSRSRAGGQHLSPPDVVAVMPLPCALTDSAGRAIERNDSFSRFMEAVGMHVTTGRLRFADPYLHDSWKIALLEVHATAVRQSLIGAAPDGRPWRVHLVPLQCALDESDPMQRALILAVVEGQSAGADLQVAPMPESSPPLTPAESEVLSGLLQGHSAKVIANSRGASVNTVRSQIMTILGKTGYHNQRSLIAAFAPSAFRNSMISGFSPLSGSAPRDSQFKG